MISKLIIDKFSSLSSAMKLIEENKQGFLVVCEKGNKLFGVLTDGDIRRAIVNGSSLNSLVKESCNKDVLTVSVSSEFKDCAKLFNQKSITFLPILRANNEVINIITKSQFMSLTLADLPLNLGAKIPQFTTNFDIMMRPWGFYKTTLMTPHSQTKILHIFPEQQLSLQKHEKREEYWVIAKGLAEVTLNESVKEMHEGSYIFIPMGCWHRLKNISKEDNLIVSEVQLGSYFGEDDIIRKQDDYNRLKEN